MESLSFQREVYAGGQVYVNFSHHVKNQNGQVAQKSISGTLLQCQLPSTISLFSILYYPTSTTAAVYIRPSFLSLPLPLSCYHIRLGFFS
ncbi:hypothetical protein L1887_32747 [Cichorium endivia]|nr:hypothetical protein L1887_32747 [Cichorium endivia]